MATVRKRTVRWTTKAGERKTAQRWQAVYADDAGREYAKLFGRKVDAQAWLDERLVV